MPAPASDSLFQHPVCGNGPWNPVSLRTAGSQDCPHGPSTPAEVRVLEVEAFGSVQDLIHASIASRGGQASLAHIYQLCHSRGRVAYRRSGGSRLITQNEHWKSQIRHTLYTNPRFERCVPQACARGCGGRRAPEPAWLGLLAAK